MEAITIDVAITSWVVFWGTYWVAGILFSWKAHTEKIRLVTNLRDVISVVCINMFWTLLGIVLLYFCPLRAMTDTHIIIKYIGTYIITDVWFYHFHLMMHHPQLYAKIHKLHHHDKMMEPFALTSLYCTPYEALFLNVFATSLGPVIFQIPPPYLYIWYFLVALNSVATHSGIVIPYLIDGNHDKHHKLFNRNFGVSIYFDWLYGTYAEDVQKEKEEAEPKYISNFPIDLTQLDNLK